MSFFDALWLVAPVFAAGGVGFLARRGGLLTSEADQSLLRLTVNILVPCLAFDVIVGNESLRKLDNLAVPPLAGCLSIAGTFGLALLTARQLGMADRTRNTFAYTVGLQNYAYLAIPICSGLFGRESLGVLFAYNLGVEVAFWTLAGAAIRRDAGRFELRRVVSVPAIAVVASALLNLAGADRWTPGWIASTIHLLGACAIPLGLILTGALIAEYAVPAHLREGRRDLLAAVMLRHGLFPAIYLAAAFALPVPTELRRVLVVQGAMPVAVFTIVVCRLYGGDMATAFRVVVGSSFLGLLTIPIWIKLGLALLRLR